MTATISFDGCPDYINVYARQAASAVTHLELWFPTSVHQRIFDFDIDAIKFCPGAKSDVMRLLRGVARTVGADGFGLRLAKEDSLFGPLGIDQLRDYVETGCRWLDNPLRLIVAGVSTERVERSRFEYDLQKKPLHYRRQGVLLVRPSMAARHSLMRSLG
jgi:hypothetical protein